jgi:four helix bundle protein
MKVASPEIVGARRVEELVAWQLANEFKREVYRLLQVSSGAQGDFRFRDQLRAAAASVGMNTAEGFHRYRSREFVRFLEIALGSLGEARLWLDDGVDRGYFARGDCRRAHELAFRCRTATIRLIQSLRTD